MNHFLRIFLLVFATSTLLLSGCRRENETEQIRAALESAEDNSTAENEFEAIFSMVDDEHAQVGKTDGADSVLPACAVVSVAPDTVLAGRYNFSIDFGATNCLCRDGYFRRGRIVGHFQGAYRTQGSTWVANTQDYFFNDIRVQGTKTVTNLGNAQTGNFRYQTLVNNAQLTFTDGTTATWSTNRTAERVQGDATLTPWDDIYQVTGTANGNNRKGRGYTANITTPLRFVMSCLQSGLSRHFVRGVVGLNSDGNTLLLDYDPLGNAACDKIATVKWNDRNPVTITLR